MFSQISEDFGYCRDASAYFVRCRERQRLSSVFILEFLLNQWVSSGAVDGKLADMASYVAGKFAVTVK
jgi:hypothetical protein